MRRREFLFGLASLWGVNRAARAAPSVSLAAAWEIGAEYQVGILRSDSADALRMVHALDVPTRAHGLLCEASGTLLAVARRPGDWLLRWDRMGRAVAWRWIEPQRAFSGHVLASADGRTLYTTEVELDTGTGLVGVRDSVSLEKHAEWSTHGTDPHDLIEDATGNRLIVANGGVPTRPETGRIKHDLARMDSSLVRLDAGTGELLGQWRLDDRRLSLRHLAWGGTTGEPVLGIALQAEHDDPTVKARAPVLALFEGKFLHAPSAPLTLGGYGGDIAALGSFFAVSCPRAQAVAVHQADGAWCGRVTLSEACALTATPGEIWAGGGHAALTWGGEVPGLTIGSSTEHALPDIRLDNHWISI